MRKSQIPQPKYCLGDTVIFDIPGDGNYSPRRDVGTVSGICITMTLDTSEVRYAFAGKEDSYDESSIQRRVLKFRD